MTKPDKRNDLNWCMQFLGTGLGVAFLAFGIVQVLGRAAVMGYWHIGIGISWILMGLVHRSRWRKKVLERGLYDCFE